MDDKKLVEKLRAVLEEQGDDLEFSEVKTFKEAGILSKNLGLVITDKEGHDHQFALLGSWDEG